MANNSNTTLAGVRRLVAPSVAGMSWRDRSQSPIALVAAAFMLVQLVLVRPGMGLGWDETVYVSQVSAHAPAAFFSAPRARGISLLVAPITSWSSSTVLLRVHLAVLSGAALFLALRVWRGLFPARVLALGGALFASLWVTLFYGPQAMPNYWVAIGALACTGCFLRAQADSSDRAALWGVAVNAALMAWMRPTDAVWATLPLLVMVVLVRTWRRLSLLLALVGGLAAGAFEWIVEAYVAYGGLAQRLSDGSRVQGGLGWHLAVVDQMRSLGGRALCRPCTVAMPNPLVTAWWYVLPLLAAFAAAVAVRRAGRAARTLVPLACAATAAIPYLFLIGYAAPRFLLPAYALLAIPVADALLHLVTAKDGRWRPITSTVVALGLVVHLGVQFAVLHGTVDRTTADHRAWSRITAELHRLGVRPPCLLTGNEAIPIAFYAGCSSAATSGNNANSTAADIARTAQRMPAAHLGTPTERPPAYARDWTAHTVDGVRILVAPTAGQGGRG
ncbi:hypothetical protein [Streptomyces colonosanans]|uniref:Glycosyltransferase RgtA/B/C/D-like domain-containing protein n=1 Tax=Streptomyces colonosanans TaxID=1428652 RepID=A0A1S2PMU9_9ACTN|nr:hypothetical protein [Streptomyces colonosanans]OIJ94244.1 hypothetical protein BIV24_11010 [Streptomyces colonosanans]